MEKYKPNWDTLKKTIIVLNEDKTIYAEYDYIDWLQFRLELIQSERLQRLNLHVRNEHGGMNRIDEFGCIDGGGMDRFSIINELYRKIIKAQIVLRKNQSIK